MEITREKLKEWKITPVNGSEQYRCEPCNTTLSGTENVKTHVNGSKHRRKIQYSLSNTTPISVTPRLVPPDPLIPKFAELNIKETEKEALRGTILSHCWVDRHIVILHDSPLKRTLKCKKCNVSFPPSTHQWQDVRMHCVSRHRPDSVASH